MSRRSPISPEENLIRSQRRGVPNARMWSEQETPPRVAWDGYEEEPLPQLITPPSRAFVSTEARNSGQVTRTAPEWATSGIHLLSHMGAVSISGPHTTLDQGTVASNQLGWEIVSSLSFDASFASFFAMMTIWFDGSGGNWIAERGEHLENTTKAGYAAPPNGSLAHVQFGAYRFIEWVEATPAGFQQAYGAGPAAVYGPVSGDYQGQAFTNLFVNRVLTVETDGYVDWGAYGFGAPFGSIGLSAGYL